MPQENQIQLNKVSEKASENSEVSKYNAQKHAILRQTITEYEKADVEEIYNGLASDLKPEGKAQEYILEILASNLVRLQRIAKAEAECIKIALDPDIPQLNFGGYKAQIDYNSAKKLELYGRYQTATENRIFRALGVLKQLKNYE